MRFLSAIYPQINPGIPKNQQKQSENKAKSKEEFNPNLVLKMLFKREVDAIVANIRTVCYL